MVWSRLRVFCFSKYDSKGHRERKKEGEVDRRRVDRQYERLHNNGHPLKKDQAKEDCCKFTKVP